MYDYCMCACVEVRGQLLGVDCLLSLWVQGSNPGHQACAEVMWPAELSSWYPQSSPPSLFLRQTFSLRCPGTLCREGWPQTHRDPPASAPECWGKRCVYESPYPDAWFLRQGLMWLSWSVTHNIKQAGFLTLWAFLLFLPSECWVHKTHYHTRVWEFTFNTLLQRLCL